MRTGQANTDHTANPEPSVSIHLDTEVGDKTQAKDTMPAELGSDPEASDLTDLDVDLEAERTAKEIAALELLYW